MIHNDLGQVAVVYYMPTPRLVGGTYFDVRHGIAMAWVDEVTVPSLLAERGGCCGATRQIVYPANQEQVNVWSTGDR